MNPTAQTLGLPSSSATSYKHSLQNHLRTQVFDFLNKAPRDSSSYVFQSDLLEAYNSDQSASCFVSPIAFGKLLSEYVSQETSFSVIKKHVQNRSAIVGIAPDSCQVHSFK